MNTAIVAIPKTEIDTIDSNTAQGLTAIIAAFGGSRAPWRDINILGVDHYVYQVEVQNENQLTPIENIANAVVIAVKSADGMNSKTNPLNTALYLDAMPDNSDGSRPVVPAEVIVKHVANPVVWDFNS